MAVGAAIGMFDVHSAAAVSQHAHGNGNTHSGED